MEKKLSVSAKVTTLLNKLVEQYTKLKTMVDGMVVTGKSNETKLVDLEARLILAEAKLALVPSYPFIPAPYPYTVPAPLPSPYNPPIIPFLPNTWGSPTCSKCGMVWASSMGYVCGTFGCPMQASYTCENKITVSDSQGTANTADGLSVNVTWTGTTVGNVSTDGDFPNTKY